MFSLKQVDVHASGAGKHSVEWQAAGTASRTEWADFLMFLAADEKVTDIDGAWRNRFTQIWEHWRKGFVDEAHEAVREGISTRVRIDYIELGEGAARGEADTMSRTLVFEADDCILGELGGCVWRAVTNTNRFAELRRSCKRAAREHAAKS